MVCIQRVATAARHGCDFVAFVGSALVTEILKPGNLGSEYGRKCDQAGKDLGNLKLAWLGETVNIDLCMGRHFDLSCCCMRVHTDHSVLEVFA